MQHYIKIIAPSKAATMAIVLAILSPTLAHAWEPQGTYATGDYVCPSLRSVVQAKLQTTPRANGFELAEYFFTDPA